MIIKLVKNILSLPFILLGYIASIPGKILIFIGVIIKKLFRLIKEIIFAPFKVLFFILSIPIKPFQWVFGKKKVRQTSTEPYCVLSDPSMTRWEDIFCDSCGELTKHKIARMGKDSEKAVVNCTKCKKWEEEYW